MAVLPEDSASTPGTHLVAHNCTEPQFQGTPSHRHTSKQNINAHKINNKIKKEKLIQIFGFHPVQKESKCPLILAPLRLGTEIS